MAINPLLIDKQLSTMNDVREQLNQYGKSIFIRPTGFGKTYLLIEQLAKKYIEKYPDKKVLYIYPLDIIVTEITGDKEVVTIKNSEDNPSEKIAVTTKIRSKYMIDGLIQLGKNFEFISYQRMSIEYNKDQDYWHNYIENNNISLIILDEAHRAGSETFYKIWDSIKDLIKPDGVHLVGATATPNRMDDSDTKEPVLDYIFDNKQAYEYNLDNALEDGLIPRIVYMADIYTIESSAKNMHKNIKKLNNKFVEDSFNTEICKLRKETGRENSVIARAIEKAQYNPVKDKYYKFIVFFVDKKDMVESAEEVENWFKEAFNDIIVTKYSLKNKFNIRTTYLASSDEKGELKELASKSKNRTYYNKTEKIEELEEKQGIVDIIFTIDMVNMGYHVPNITGIMMKRGTKSEITYYQQLGRALSVAAEHNPIVLDFANNIGEYFWFKKNATERVNTGNVISERTDSKLNNILINYVDTLDSFSRFMERFSRNTESLEIDEIKYLYNDMQMPIYILAAYKKLTIVETINLLKRCKLKLRTEENQYRMLMDMAEFYERTRNSEKLKEIANVIRFVNYKEAVYGKCKYITNKAKTTLYNSLNKT